MAADEIIIPLAELAHKTCGCGAGRKLAENVTGVIDSASVRHSSIFGSAIEAQEMVAIGADARNIGRGDITRDLPDATVAADVVFGGVQEKDLTVGQLVEDAR